MKNAYMRAFGAVLFSVFPQSAQAAPATANFQNDLLIQNLFISNPYQADVTSSYNGTLNGKLW